MAYQVNDIKELDKQIDILLKDNLSESDEKVLFGIRGGIEKSYQEKKTLILDRAEQIEILTKYDLMRFMEEINGRGGVVMGTGTRPEPEMPINPQGGGSGFDEVIIKSIQHAIKGDSGGELRSAIQEAFKLAQQAGPFQEQAKQLLNQAREKEEGRFDLIEQPGCTRCLQVSSAIGGFAP
jgi:hypothetical protein